MDWTGQRRASKDSQRLPKDRLAKEKGAPPLARRPGEPLRGGYGSGEGSVPPKLRLGRRIGYPREASTQVRRWPWDRHTHRGSGAAALLGPGLPQTPLLFPPTLGGVPEHAYFETKKRLLCSYGYQGFIWYSRSSNVALSHFRSGVYKGKKKEHKVTFNNTFSSGLWSCNYMLVQIYLAGM